MTTRSTLPITTYLQRVPAARDSNGRSQRELVAASLLLCPSR
jgi:hypothetical protein